MTFLSNVSEYCRASRTAWTIGVVAAVVGVVAAVVAVVGVSGVAAQDGVDAGAVARVSLDEYLFEPAVPVAPSGAVRLELANVGLRRHNMVVLVDGVEIESPHVRPGETVVWELPIARAGTYAFWCNEYRHLEKGMVGTLAVE